MKSLIVASWTMVVAAESTTGLESWVDLVQIGGAVATLLIFLYGFKAEWWVTGQIYRQRVEEGQEYRTRLDSYRDKVEGEVIPLLVRATEALSQVAERRRSGS